MLKSWPWVVAAIVLSSFAASFVLGLELIALFSHPAIGGSTGGLGQLLTLSLIAVAVPCFIIGLAAVGLPVAHLLRKAGRDGYVSAILAGAIGAPLVLALIAFIVEPGQSPALFLAYPATMILPGGVAGFIMRRLAYVR